MRIKKVNYFFLAIISIIFCQCKNKKQINEFVYQDMYMSNTINPGATVTFNSEESNFKRDDIIVFLSPINQKMTCLRIIGLPKDKIEIIKGNIFINDSLYNRKKTSTSVYTVFSKNPAALENFKNYNFKSYSENYGMINTTVEDAEHIRDSKIVDSIYQLGFDSTYIYPQIIKTSSSHYFNHYYFGPIFIPKIGDVLYANDKQLVQSFIAFKSDKQIIEEDFFFCLGDSFSDAMDSRVIGLIPKSKILGKVTKIVNSKIITTTNNLN